MAIKSNLVSQVIIKDKNSTWIHYRKIQEEDLKKLRSNFDFHPLDFNDIKTGTPISKVDTYEKYIFCVFHIPHIDTQSGRIEGKSLYVFIMNDLLITITNHPFRAVETFVKKIQKNKDYKKRVFSKGSGYTLQELLQHLFQKTMPLITSFDEDVKRLELDLQNTHARKTTVELGRVRRNILYTRHIIDPQRKMLDVLKNTKRPFINKELAPYIGDTEDLLDTIWLTCDNLKLIIDGLFDVNEALLSHRTNRIVTLLTIISASLMAPTLIAGFYGMNVPWLPFIHSPSTIGLLYFIAFFVIIFAVLMIVLRKWE
ncbi:MAG: magnesium transporter CorA family protein [Patescibacteria group bacterium]